MLQTASSKSQGLSLRCACSQRVARQASSRPLPQSRPSTLPGSSSCQAGRRSRSRVATAALKEGEVGKFISKTEIPAFIPRTDLMEQLYRWATYTVSDPYSAAQFGMPMKISPMYRGEGEIWGLSAAIVKDGETATTIIARFDEEVNVKLFTIQLVNRHSYVGRKSDGFPSLEGDKVEVEGAHLELWKVDKNVIDDQTRNCIREFCSALVAAINKYYAFGSAFVDDAT